MYNIAYLFFSLAGLGFFPLYGLHLLDMSLTNPQVQNVLKAVTVNGKSILLTVSPNSISTKSFEALLAVTIIYIYAIAGFWFLRPTYDVDSGLDCDTLYKCLLTTFNYGYFVLDYSLNLKNSVWRWNW